VGGGGDAHAPSGRPEVDHEGHAPAGEEPVDDIALVLEVLAQLLQDPALVRLLGVTREHEPEHYLGDEIPVLDQAAAQPEDQLVFRVVLARGDEEPFEAGVDQLLQRRLETGVRIRVLELVDVQVAPGEVEMEAIYSEIIAAEGYLANGPVPGQLVLLFEV
jgi:hypothetical protein